MGNHVHLLLQEQSETIGETMKRIASSYVYYYNHKYARIGHLFQERFKSQPVDSWEYFVTLLRYIHQNPLKAHLVDHIEDYPWSSWQEYDGRCGSPFCSTQTVLKRIDLVSLRELVEHPLADNEEDGLLDVEVTPVKTYFEDNEVWQILTDCSGATTLAEFQSLPRPKQKHYLFMAHEQGVGPRQLSRLTGISYAIVQRATSAANERLLSDAGMACESTLEDDLYATYCDEGANQKYPEY